MQRKEKKKEQDVEKVQIAHYVKNESTAIFLIFIFDFSFRTKNGKNRLNE